MNMLATQYQPRLSRITDAAQGGSAYQIAVYIHSHQIKLLSNNRCLTVFYFEKFH